jgi:hypothetical protein
MVGVDIRLIGTYNSASAYVFRWSGSDWDQTVILTVDGIIVGDRFGTAVSIGKDVAVVGAYNDEGGRGSAFVYTLNKSDWTLEDTLYGNDSVAGDNCGYSVAVDGDYAVVGAYLHNGQAGAVYVFERRLVQKK